MHKSCLPSRQFDIPIEGVGTLLGLKEPLKFEDDCCALKFDDVAINMQRDMENNRIVLSGYLVDLPESVEPRLLEQLLAANLYWRAGATICLEPSSRALLMLHPEPVFNLAGRQLLARLQAFAANVAKGREKMMSILGDRK